MYPLCTRGFRIPTKWAVLLPYLGIYPHTCCIVNVIISILIHGCLIQERQKKQDTMKNRPGKVKAG